MMKEEAPPVAEVLVLRRARQLAEPFDYEIPEDLSGQIKPGSLVRIPLGNSEAIGVVTRLKDSSEYRNLKKITELMTKTPALMNYQVELFQWMSSFYLESPGSVISLFFPPGYLTSLKKTVSLISSDMYPDLYLFLLEKGGSAYYQEIEHRFGREKAKKLTADAIKRSSVSVYWTAVTGRTKPHVSYEIAIADRDALNELIRVSKSRRIRALLRALIQEGSLNYELAKAEFNTGLNELKKLALTGAIALNEVFSSRLNQPAISAAEEDVVLNEFQKNALKEIKQAILHNSGEEFLLFGPTGSGKTEIYLKAAEFAFAQGLGVIYLVPEISLTPQTYSRVEKRFGNLTAVFHSGLKSGERLDEWVHIQRGLKRVVVGARSALFVPMENPGLIIIDEEHDGSYYQSSSPVYDARRVARKIAETTGAVVIYGSATPSVEKIWEARRGVIKLLELPERVSGEYPEIKVIDLKKEKALISEVMKQEIIRCIENREKALIFLNRRGYAVVEVCSDCGYLATCPRCTIYLRYHRDADSLTCHYCGYSRNPDRVCPECGSEKIEMKGRGIQKVEAELNELVKGKAKVLRVDSDVAREGKARKNMVDFFSEESAVLVGTQMITKGLHLPEITFVGVVNADVGLQLPDFRSEERTFQTLVQVVGRAGRGEKRGKVIIQSWQPDRDVIRYVVSGDYKSFYRHEIELRRTNNLPPFSFLIRVLLHASDESRLLEAAKEIEEKLQNLSHGIDFEYSGPFPAPLYRLHGKYRLHALIKFPSEPSIDALEKLRKGLIIKTKAVKLKIEIAPVSLL